MVARYDRPMQSSRARVDPAPSVERSHRRPRSPHPSACRSWPAAPARWRSWASPRPRGALVPALPVRRLQRAAPAGRARAGREAVGARAGRGGAGRARLRAAAAARDRPAVRRRAAAPRRSGSAAATSSAGCSVGDELIVSGKVTSAAGAPQFTSPEFTPVGRESVHTARVVPGLPPRRGGDPEAAARAAGADPGRALPGVVDPLTDAERGGAAGPRRCPAHRALSGGGRRRDRRARPARLRRAARASAHPGPGAPGAGRAARHRASR